MTEHVFYEGNGVKITSARIEGKHGIVLLDSVQRLEIKSRMINRLLALGLAGGFFWGVHAASTSHWAWWFVSGFCALTAFNMASVRALYAQMAHKKMLLCDDQWPSELRKMTNAFGDAKLTTLSQNKE